MRVEVFLVRIYKIYPRGESIDMDSSDVFSDELSILNYLHDFLNCNRHDIMDMNHLDPDSCQDFVIEEGPDDEPEWVFKKTTDIQSTKDMWKWISKEFLMDEDSPGYISGIKFEIITKELTF